MKFFHLSRLSIIPQTIVAVQWHLSLPDGRKTTVIYHNIPGVSPFQLYSDKPKYEEDILDLMNALADEVTLEAKDFDCEEGTPLEHLHLSPYIYSPLREKGIDTAEKLEAISDLEIMDINGLGTGSVRQIRNKLKIWRNVNEK